ncbi:MAG TPA: hypothetical protein VLA51_06785 [Paracoccaceae bacterium]|nr:hypothetical protein [Paracoccaceae bacterium]
MSQNKPTQDDIEVWWSRFGSPLKEALVRVKEWSLEGEPERPRKIGFQEFSARANGYLSFDDDGYSVDPGFAEVIRKLATASFEEHLPDDEEIIPDTNTDNSGSTIMYDLAVRIAEQNKKVGRPIPNDLLSFSDPETRPDSPRKRGDDFEARIFRSMLAAWGIQRAVDLGINPSRNRVDALNPRPDKLPCAADMVLDAFHDAGWLEMTYDMVLSPWRDLQYGGTSNQRRLLKSTNSDVYDFRFEQLDDLIPKVIV